MILVYNRNCSTSQPKSTGQNRSGQTLPDYKIIETPAHSVIDIIRRVKRVADLSYPLQRAPDDFDYVEAIWNRAVI